MFAAKMTLLIIYDAVADLDIVSNGILAFDSRRPLPVWQRRSLHKRGCPYTLEETKLGRKVGCAKKL